MSLVVPPYPPPRYTKDAPEVSAWLKRSDEPPDYQTYGVKYHYLANQQATGGDYGLYRVDIDPAGGGPPEHFHRAMSEAFFVLSGTMKLYDGSKNGDWLDSAGRHDRRRTPGVVHPPRQLLRVDVLPPGSAELREVGTLRLALLDEDEHHAPRVDEPCCANSRHVGGAVDKKAHAVGLELGPGGIEVLADQPHMRQPVVGNGRGAALIAARDAEILDHLEHTISVVVEADDGRFHGGIGHQLAHVVANRVTGHHVRRRQHT